LGNLFTENVNWMLHMSKSVPTASGSMTMGLPPAWVKLTSPVEALLTEMLKVRPPQAVPCSPVPVALMLNVPGSAAPAQPCEKLLHESTSCTEPSVTLEEASAPLEVL
jgi:hypothetical protein